MLFQYFVIVPAALIEIPVVFLLCTVLWIISALGTNKFFFYYYEFFCTLILNFLKYKVFDKIPYCTVIDSDVVIFCMLSCNCCSFLHLFKYKY